MHNYVSGGNLQTFWGKVKNWIETNFYKKNDVYMKSETYAKADVYNKNEIDSKLGKKSDTGHTHDDRYYTESEIDSKISTINDSVSSLINSKLELKIDIEVKDCESANKVDTSPQLTKNSVLFYKATLTNSNTNSWTYNINTYDSKGEFNGIVVIDLVKQTLKTFNGISGLTSLASWTLGKGTSTISCLIFVF